MSFKKVQVRLLPTNEKSNIYLNEYADDKNKANKLVFGVNIKEELTSTIEQLENRGYKAQHLYFISDDEIKNDDWVYDPIGNRVTQIKIVSKKGENFGAKKIIATTDSSLQYHDKTPIGENTNGLWKCLPQPSQSFLEKYVEEYNKDNVIIDVLVEYEEDFNYDVENISKDASCNDDLDIIKTITLKTNPKDNTITIKQVKDSWDRDELIIILNKFGSKVYMEYAIPQTIEDFTEKWIEENL